MKRLAMVLIVLFTATSLLAGGKECEKKSSAKNVELTGTIVRTGAGDEAKSVFRVANSDQSYVICHKSKADVLKLSKDANSTFKVKGKVVSCGEAEGDELVIDEARKV